MEFIEKRYPGIASSSVLQEQPKPGNQLPPEVLTTMLMCLQATVSNISPSIGQKIMQLLTNCRQQLAKPSTQPPPPPPQQPQSSMPSMNPNPGGESPVPTPPAPISMPVVRATFTGLHVSNDRFGQVTPTTPAPTAAPQLQRPTNLGEPFGGITANVPPQTTPSSSGFSGLLTGLAGWNRGGLPGAASPVRGMLTSQTPHPIGGGQNISMFSDQPGSSAVGSTGGMHRSASAMGAPISHMASFIQQNLPTPISSQPPAINQQAPIGPNAVPGQAQHQVATMGPDINQDFTQPIQEEANSYFQQIYATPPSPTITIEQFLDTLKQFQQSQNKKDRDVFSCMLKNLFDEYKFFPQYPERELYITSLLFGGIIREGLVTDLPLAFALRSVLEALKKEQGSKMWYFGLCALDQYKTRLKEFATYCHSMMNMLQFLPRNITEVNLKLKI